MNILYVESKEEKAKIVASKLGTGACNITRATGVIDAAGLVGLKDFDFVLISDLGTLSPIGALVNRLLRAGIPHAYLIPKTLFDSNKNQSPNLTLDELDDKIIDQLIAAGV